MILHRNYGHPTLATRSLPADGLRQSASVRPRRDTIRSRRNQSWRVLLDSPIAVGNTLLLDTSIHYSVASNPWLTSSAVHELTRPHLHTSALLLPFILLYCSKSHRQTQEPGAHQVRNRGPGAPRDRHLGLLLPGQTGLSNGSRWAKDSFVSTVETM